MSHSQSPSGGSGAIWPFDARGRLRTRYSAGLPVDPADLAHDLRMLLDET